MNIVNSIKENFFYRQHPETAIRYAPIVKLLEDLKMTKSKILEVGSGSYGITPYLKEKIIGVDNNFTEPDYPLLKQVLAKGEKLPFSDSSFEVVIVSDVLEHIPRGNREKFLKECVRVGSKIVIVSGPFGKLAGEQDRLLANYSAKKIGEMHPYFEEHLKYGLPEIKDIKNYLTKEKKVKQVKLVGNFFNLSARELLMKIYITDSKLQYYFYLKGMMFLVPIFRRLNKPPCYRSLFLIEL